MENNNEEKNIIINLSGNLSHIDDQPERPLTSKLAGR